MYHFNMSTFVNADYADPNIDVDTFAPTGLDIDQWLDAAVSAGMKYAVLTAKHHDGFALWPTAFHVGENPPYSIAQTEWYANNGNPDIVSLFVTKCRARNLNPCLYFSVWDKTWETQTGTDQTTNAAGYIAMVEAQLNELLTDYGDLTALWFDGWGWHVGYTAIPYATIYDYIKAIQPSCLVIENNNTHPGINSEIETWEFPIAGSITAGNTRPSEEVNTIREDGKWFYNSTADQSAAALTPAATILSRITSANANSGTYLLSMSPATDGHLPAAQVTRLGELGA